MSKINKKDFAGEVEKIQKQITVIEKERDLALEQIRKKIEARQIKKVVDSLK
ncbi:hypothetical protein L6270_02590 [Candidatus Parcubacteria bacterium]|nr:hypothetical protein [Patescibacteria group bacterium]MBU4309912.1 hypothetical protein [Patescibacteria group bacterium]MBU4432542.1 hypothetical protein [Patescibacteria group bacterium]MBU4577837.1 hypothetical protein [Patescibacteria group bacterium]MCG2696898.1 hypothetical protein [Candidatus Parcubacteria bacterium]